MNWARGFKRTRLFLSLVAATVIVIAAAVGFFSHPRGPQGLFEVGMCVVVLLVMEAVGFLGVWVVLWVVHRLVRWVVLGFLDK